MTLQDVREQGALPGGQEEPSEPVQEWAAAAPLWRRVSAFLLDSALLVAAGAVLCFLLRDLLVPLGNGGKLVGLAIAALYFVPRDGRPGNGQTPGKRLLGIRVVDRFGGAVSTARSACRFLVAATPVFLIGIRLTYGMYNWVAVFLAMFLSFGLGGGLVYFVLFNRRTGQSLHDLVFDTYVISVRTGNARLIGQRVALRHYAIFSAYLFFISAFVLWNTPRMISAEQFRHVVEIKKLLSSQDGVMDSSVKWGSYLRGEGSYMDVTVYLEEEPASYARAVDDAASTVVKGYPHMGEVDNLTVTAVHGYDIGIFWSFRNSSVSNTPAWWRSRIGPEDAG
ncbi:MAG: RDD family protein [Nitrospirae bacterium]|nr:RDD family protein [Nitrospirota bacterium]